MKYFFLIVSILVLVIVFLTISNFKIIDFEKSKELQRTNEACQKWRLDEVKNYDSLCKCEDKWNIQFPASSVTWGKIYYFSNEDEDIIESLFYDSIRVVDDYFIDELRTIVSDSSNFRWGEFGTPFFSLFIEFYNMENEMVDFLAYDYQGQIRSSNMTATMKWGLLNDCGCKKIMNLIKLY
jgi:hypothetical protein